MVACSNGGHFASVCVGDPDWLLGLCRYLRAGGMATDLQGGSGVSHLGMTLASDVRGSKMIACGPGLAEHCDKNLYLSGICYLFDTITNLPIRPTECLKGNVDLVFLFDGSESMKNRDFSNITEFMIGVMDGLHNSTFAAVQFSSSPKIEFDFNDYTRNPNPRALLKGVTHMKGITNTFKAIRCVVDQVFIPERGMRKGSNKVIIIITDGVASDSDNGVIASAKKKGILRLAIGIGHYFNTEEAQDNLREIASEPTDQFVKVLATFEELRGSFNDLQSKIYAIEGTSDTGSFHLELSSSGLSADISQGRVVLGAVGADNWAGGLLEQQKGLASEKFITTPSVRKEMEGAYLGYALKFLQHQQRELYAAGAPRYQHVGRVLIFEVNSSTTNWTLKQDIPGQQIGSYFGAALCSVDVDGDKETDLLLVGAPQYFTEMRGGRVYVYTWKQVSRLTGDPGYRLGRFGAAITDLSDISGDGLMDVAVGAPSEDEERGAVYIYYGHEKTLQMQYSQRISGARISPGLVFFGQSIHGKRDLNGDGLTDIAVGALGKVVVLRSRPIITVVTKVHSSPKEIPREDVECLGDASTWKNLVVDLSICFSTSLATKHYQGEGYQGIVDLAFSLILLSRGVFITHICRVNPTQIQSGVPKTDSTLYTSFWQLLLPSWCQTSCCAFLWTTSAKRGSCCLGSPGPPYILPRLMLQGGHFDAIYAMDFIPGCPLHCLLRQTSVIKKRTSLLCCLTGRALQGL
uniref:Integrin subunit alpha L n=1 Tax=Podarcis muralis TaxID=64176 RepID=A0A670JE38_PODMU